MSITSWSIRHSVTVLVLMGVIVIAGLMAYRGLPREAAPDITIPVVLVSTPYIGVSPADIEKLVTTPLEDELETLKDVRKLSSTSADGVSIITIEFEPDVDIESALQKVRERVDSARPELPGDLTDEPSVQEISFSEFPIMIINISGDVGLTQLEQHAEDLQDRLESIEGVLEVKLVGGLEREISIEADPAKLEYYNVSLAELAQAIQGRNLTMPGGAVELGELRYPVRVPGEFRRVPEIADVVVREVDGEPIRVWQVARVVDGYEEQKTYSRVGGQTSLSLSLTRRAGENILRIATEVREILAESEKNHGGRIKYTIVGDISKNINERVAELENNILTGLLLVAGVLLFFMGGLRNALFVAIAIPFSMLISFAILSALDITLNMIVLFALVLALGMLVDNAIVIVENIYRHGQMDKTIVQAALDGTAEVAWPVIASTLTTVFAFFPMMFWPGIMGEFMYYLPLTVVIVLMSSLFVGLVINPVVCALFMKIKKPKRKKGVTAEEEAAEAAARTALPPGEDELAALPRNPIYSLYGATLRFCLRQRWLVFVVVVLAFVGTFAVYGAKNKGVEFFPEMTPERIYVNVTLPDGSNLDASDRIVRATERALAEHDNIKAYVADVGAGNGNVMDFGAGGSAAHRSRITAEFFDVSEQSEDPYVTIERVREALSTITGAEIDVVKEEGGPPTGPPINIELVGEDYETLGRLAEQVELVIAQVPDVVNIKSDYQAGRPEITVRVLPDRAAAVGLTTADVANTVRIAINGLEASKFRDGDDEYDIVVRLQESHRDSVEAIERLRIKSFSGEMVPLSEVATVQVERGFGSIRHIDGDRVVTVSAETTDSMAADAALKGVQKRVAEEVVVPAGYELRYTGQNKDQAEAQDFLSKALLAALFLIALVLVTQFNSVIQPFIILCSVILSLLGVLWTLVLREMPFGVIMTGIGVISLAGVVVNNAIVLIDYANQLRDRGIPVRRALYIAGMVRLRPVLLTAGTTILSLMPIVLGYNIDVRTMTAVQGGSSVEMWSNMSNVVAGGLIVATGLTLIVVPVMYSSFESMKAFFRRLFRRGSSTGDAGPDDFPDSPKKAKKKKRGKNDEHADASVTTPASEAAAPAPESPAEEPVLGVKPAVTVAILLVIGGSWLGTAEAQTTREEFDGEYPVITLEEAYTLMREQNTTLELVETALERARIYEAQAYNLAYPSVLLTASYTLNDAEVTFDQPNVFAAFGPYLDSVYANDPALQQYFTDNPGAVDARALAAAPGSSVVIQNRHDVRAQLTVTQPLFDYRLFPGLRIADLTRERALLAREETLYELDRAVLQLYFSAVSFQRLIEVSKRNVELARVNYERAVAALELDVGLRFEVNRTEVALKAAERNVENARLAYRLAIDGLATLLETEPQFDVEQPRELTPPRELDTLIESAIATRTSISSLQLESEIASARIDEINARWWPTVQAQAAAWVQRGTAFGGEDTLRWAITVSANWLIFDGGYRLVEADHFEVDIAEKNLQVALEQQEVAAEVRQAWLRVQTEQQNVANARAEVELAQLNVELTEEARALDAARAIDVELAQQQRYIAEVALSRAEVELQARIYELYQLAGLAY